MRSIHALSCDGMPKLYMGAPITTMSAARNSSTMELSAKPSNVRFGSGSATSSRRTTRASGITALNWSTSDLLIVRLTLLSPLMLLSICRIVIGFSVSLSIAFPSRGDPLSVAPSIEARLTGAKLGEEERCSEHRAILHEHDHLHLSGLLVADPPEPVHHKGDRDQEEHQQPGSDLSLVPDQDAEPAGQRDQP